MMPVMIVRPRGLFQRVAADVPAIIGPVPVSAAPPCLDRAEMIAMSSAAAAELEK